MSGLSVRGSTTGLDIGVRGLTKRKRFGSMRSGRKAANLTGTSMNVNRKYMIHRKVDNIRRRMKSSLMTKLMGSHAKNTLLNNVLAGGRSKSGVGGQFPGRKTNPPNPPLKRSGNLIRKIKFKKLGGKEVIAFTTANRGGVAYPSVLAAGKRCGNGRLRGRFRFDTFPIPDKQALRDDMVKYLAGHKAKLAFGGE